MSFRLAMELGAAGPNVVITDPTRGGALLGRRTPIPEAHVSGALFGIHLGPTKAHVVRAVLEGVVFGIRDSAEIFREIDIPHPGHDPGGSPVPSKGM